ncbi:UNVERIFIED_ORG: GntR family transcriptional regulator [Bacillus sp. AZ43]|jgi:GntR family transcriptional regulator|uniref:GntR family transcriptional regulator n=3 Tax=Geodermatophilaceae TaxID=85030 RepID=A0A285VGA2_9ACTN|nr:GntR family transcriptional regulator [Blastococcus aggregatus]SOC52993.1 GntR family transcriptional regulator [Blastococcus aggregatus]
MPELPRIPPAARLDRHTNTPLWRQLAADLRDRLDGGEFTEGFPGEVELGLQYSVSRHTVREALRQLRADGVISTGRGRRPRLAALDPVIAQPTGIAYSLFSSVEACGLVQTSVVRVLTLRADGVIAPRLGLEESTPLVHLERLRLADDRPLALDRVWLPASIGEPLLDVDFRRTSLYEELARTGIPVTGGQETVRAVIPSRAEHDALDLQPPSAVFSVERTGTSSGVPVEWRHTLIRADRFALTSTLDPRPGATEPPSGDLAASALTPSFG